MALRPPNRKSNPTEQKSEIGGWLLVYLILMLISVIYSLISIISSIILMNSNILSIFGSSLVINAGTIIFDSIVFLLNVGIILMIFSKKTTGPKWIITLVWAGFVIGLIKLGAFVIPATVKSLSSPASSAGLSSSALLWTAIVSSLFGLIFGIALNVIITLYFKKSQRVKNTFVK